VRAAVILEIHPFPDTCAGLRAGLFGVQIDTLVFQGAPQALDKDAVQITTFAVHRDADTGPTQAVCLGKRRELGPLIDCPALENHKTRGAVHDVGRSEPIDCFVQRLDTEVGIQSVRC